VTVWFSRPPRGAARGRSWQVARVVALVALLLAPAALLAADAAARPYAGLSLAEALADLQGRGLKVIYSEELVRPEMRVVEEPRAAWLHDVLAELLAQHGLAARVGPGGSLLVVRAGPAPVEVRLLRPLPGDVTAGEIEVVAEVTSSEPIAWVDVFVNGWPAARLRSPPWVAIVTVPDEPGPCRFSVVARSTTGGRGSATVATQRVVLEERVDVSLRQVHVAVTRSRGSSPLRREDFRLYDGGELQQIASFSRGDVPLSALLLIDASESMRGETLQAAFSAARDFISRLAPDDEAAVMVFADRLLSLTPFGPPEPGLLEGVEHTPAAGGTALNDHVYAALRLLDGRPGRRVVVLLSDGADVVSALSTEDLMWKVRRTDATLYWLRLSGMGDGWSFMSAWRDAAGNQHETEGLVAAVEESGGRVESLERPGDLPASLTDLLNELREQYVLGYYPNDLRGDGSWRPVGVGVNVPGVRVRYRNGWVDRP
jgi:Ca-activated chloride channel family protein